MKPHELEQQRSLLKHLTSHQIIHGHLVHAILTENHEDVVLFAKLYYESADIMIAYLRNWKFPLFADSIPADPEVARLRGELERIRDVDLSYAELKTVALEALLPAQERNR